MHLWSWMRKERVYFAQLRSALHKTITHLNKMQRKNTSKEILNLSLKSVDDIVWKQAKKMTTGMTCRHTFTPWCDIWLFIWFVQTKRRRKKQKSLALIELECEPQLICSYLGAFSPDPWCIKAERCFSIFRLWGQKADLRGQDGEDQRCDLAQKQALKRERPKNLMNHLQYFKGDSLTDRKSVGRPPWS